MSFFPEPGEFERLTADLHLTPDHDVINDVLYIPDAGIAFDLLELAAVMPDTDDFAVLVSTRGLTVKTPLAADVLVRELMNAAREAADKDEE